METLSVIVNGREYVPKEEPVKEKIDNSTPPFKEGDWIFFEGKSHSAGPFRLVKVDGVTGYSGDNADNFHDLTDTGSRYRLATHEEIETYLIAEAERRGYIGKKVKDLSEIAPSQKHITFFDEYNKKSDRLWYYAADHISTLIYEKGKWAEIIKEPRPIPQNADELETILREFSSQKFSAEGFIKHYFR